jgi:hypothetical protein
MTHPDPTKLYEISEDFHVAGTASDNDRVERVTMSIYPVDMEARTIDFDNPVHRCPAVGLEQWSYTVDPGMLEPGSTYAVEARAFDPTGNFANMLVVVTARNP